MLAIEPGAPIIIVRRLLKFNARPVVIDEIYLPGEVFQGLSAETLQGWNGSLYSLFETRFGVRMIRAPRNASARSPPTWRRRRSASGRHAAAVGRACHVHGGDRPVEWRRGLYSTAEHFI